ncbi:MAG: hypothetical protein WC284_16560 [Candidimonas sp.]
MFKIFLITATLFVSTTSMAQDVIRPGVPGPINPRPPEGFAYPEKHKDPTRFDHMSQTHQYYGGPAFGREALDNIDRRIRQDSADNVYGPCRYDQWYQYVCDEQSEITWPLTKMVNIPREYWEKQARRMREPVRPDAEKTGGEAYIERVNECKRIRTEVGRYSRELIRALYDRTMEVRADGYLPRRLVEVEVNAINHRLNLTYLGGYFTYYENRHLKLGEVEQCIERSRETLMWLNELDQRYIHNRDRGLIITDTSGRPDWYITNEEYERIKREKTTR